MEKNFRPCGSTLYILYPVTPLKKEVNELKRKIKDRTVSEGLGGIMDKRIQNCSQLLEDGELSILEFLEVAQNFTYNLQP